MRRRNSLANGLTAVGWLLIAASVVHHLFRLVAGPDVMGQWFDASSWELELGLMALGALGCASGLAAMMRVRPGEHDSVAP